MALTIFEIELFPIKKKYVRLINPQFHTSLRDELANLIPIDEIGEQNLFVHASGKLQDLTTSYVLPGAIYRIHGKTCGGKGGFGSLLRAIGMQIEKTKNKEACRDLSGRRMRDVNNEKKLKEWFSKAADRMLEKERKKRERRERLLAEPKHMFDDQEYMQQKEQVIEDMEAALEAGMAKARKRALRQKAQETSRAGVDVSALSSSSDSDSELSSNLDDLPPPDLEFSDEDSEQGNKPDSVVEPEVPGAEISSDQKPEETVAESYKSVNSIEKEFDAIDIAKICSVDDLRAFGLDHLKAELRRRGMKCGGTLEERVKRLWELKSPPTVNEESAEQLKKKAKKRK